MDTTTLAVREADGCYHPATEAELAALVRHAHDQRLQLRVMGSSHSVWKAIVTDSFDGPATPARELLVVLDRYTKIFELKPDPANPQCRLVEVQAGCHVGMSPKRPVQARMVPRPAKSDVLEPSPWHDGSWEASVTQRLYDLGYALPDLGGISHQTVAGFISTGSAGGTVKWSVHEAIVGLRVIDGQGNVKELRRDGPDVDWFRAAGIGLGLCGVISTVTFRAVPNFDIVGSETISATAQSDDLDFYGNRPDSGLPSLERFLVETDYARLMWWPQRDFDRLVVWQARRAPFDANRQLKPYREIAHFPVASQVAASVIYTVLGHIDSPEAALEQLKGVRARNDLEPKVISTWLRRMFAAPPPDPAFPDGPQASHPYLAAILQMLEGERHSPVTLGAAWIFLVELLLSASDEVLAVLLKLPVLKQVFALLGRHVPEYIDEILGLFVTSGPGGSPATQQFEDRAFLGLTMDNQMDDLLMPTWFTELWFPFTEGDGKVQKVISKLKELFNADFTPEGMYRATGSFAFELYAGKAERTFFMSPAAGDQNVFRVDVFWFGTNPEDPVTGFFKQFWDALEPLGFRLHWGKFLPAPGTGGADRLTRNLPGFAKWKAVRERVDPRDVFLTKYWKDHLGL